MAVGWICILGAIIKYAILLLSFLSPVNALIGK